MAEDLDSYWRFAGDVTSGGRVTIPAKYLDKTGIDQGDQIKVLFKPFPKAVVEKDGEIVAEKDGETVAEN